MSAIRVKKTAFGSAANIYRADEGGLAAMIRGIAIDNACLAVKTANVTALTDNSTGTSQTDHFVDLVVPGKFDASSAGGAQLTALNTSLGKMENAGKVLTNSLNGVRAVLGLTALSAASGTEATANTIPAQDKTATTASGASAADYESGVATLKKAKYNMERLIRGFNETLVAIGETPLPKGLTGDLNGDDYALVALTAITASADGSSSISKAATDAFLTAWANNLATLAAVFSSKLVASHFTAHALNVVAA